MASANYGRKSQPGVAAPAVHHRVTVAQQSILSHGGHYLAAGPAPTPVEGTWDSSGFVVIQFPDMDRIRQWYDSAEYRRAREIRKDKARVTMLFVEGAPPDGFTRPA